MCELFALSADHKIAIREPLREFFSHSVTNPNGWGLAVFRGDQVSLEKEPCSASESTYLAARMAGRWQVQNMMAHIRKATIGKMTYENSHPFVREDSSGRTWTFMHNGTIFDAPRLDMYFYRQEGTTDSERILLYLIDRVNEKLRTGQPFRAEERFRLVDDVAAELSMGNNKLNFILYDGELMYAHCNYRHSLYVHEAAGEAVISTTKLNSLKGWEPVPMCRVTAWQNGMRLFTGKGHGREYIQKAGDLDQIYMNYAEL